MEWRTKWKCDASVPETAFAVTDRWVVGVGVKRLHLFHPLTGKNGPRLEDAHPPRRPARQPLHPDRLLGRRHRPGRLVHRRRAGSAVVWDLTTGKVIGRPSLPDGLSQPAFTADGKHLLAADTTGRLVGYDVRTGKLTRRLAARNVDEVNLSPDGTTLAVRWGVQFGGLGGIDGLVPGGIVRLLNPATGELLPQSPDPSAELKAVRFADARAVAVALHIDSLNMSHVVWDTRTGCRRLTLPPRSEFPVGGLGNPLPASGGDLSPDGTRYLSLSDRSLVVSDAFTRRPLHAFDLPAVNVANICFWVGRGVVACPDAAVIHLFDLTSASAASYPSPTPRSMTPVVPPRPTAASSSCSTPTPPPNVRSR